MRCGECSAWAPPEKGGDPGAPGQCRAHPPQVFMFQQVVQVSQLEVAEKNAQLRVSFPAAFPAMFAEGWCAEFRAAH